MTINLLKYYTTTIALLLLLTPSMLMAQDDSRRFSLNFGGATWLNQCDVPAAEQDSRFEPSFGPFMSVSYGKFILGVTFFNGHFHIDAEDGISRGGREGFQFSNEVARQKRFTTTGSTSRMDLDINLRYVFNRMAQISFGFTLNRHSADLTTLRAPRELFDGSGIVLPSDRQNISTLEYTSNQFWISEGFHGSLGIETISNRFNWFYNATVLIIAGETGSGTVSPYLGLEKEFDTGHITYRPISDEDSGNEGLIFEALENRKIGTNAGLALSSGLGFEVFDKPSMIIFMGYSFKFFAEKETDLVDHSTFHGPYMGLSWNVF